MTKNQELNQCDGPWRPSAQRLEFILSTIPKHVQIRAISINGQAGRIVVETYYEELHQEHEFDLGKLEEVA